MPSSTCNSEVVTRLYLILTSQFLSNGYTMMATPLLQALILCCKVMSIRLNTGNSLRSQTDTMAFGVSVSRRVFARPTSTRRPYILSSNIRLADMPTQSIRDANKAIGSITRTECNNLVTTQDVPGVLVVRRICSVPYYDFGGLQASGVDWLSSNTPHFAGMYLPVAVTILR